MFGVVSRLFPVVLTTVGPKTRLTGIFSCLRTKYTSDKHFFSSIMAERGNGIGNGRQSPSRRKLIIDVDTGIDDAHAIMLAVSRPEIEVVAITCANGNVNVNDVTANTLRVLKVCERLDVPVFRGASRSLLGEVSEFYNFGGSVWHEPVDLGLLQTEHAASALVRLVNQFPGEITLVSLAPLTNVALAMHLDDDFPKKLQDIMIMGGNVGRSEKHELLVSANRRISPCAEFNFLSDPEAAHFVLSGMTDIRILPFEVCSCHRLPWEFMEEWTQKSTAKSNFLRNSLECEFERAREKWPEGYRTFDGYAMATVIDPSIVTKEESAYATVEISGKFTRGQLIVDWYGMSMGEHNVRLVMGLDMTKVQNLLLSMTVPQPDFMDVMS